MTETEKMLAGKIYDPNFNLTCVDDADIHVGSHTMIGPNVTICTAAHPLSPALRSKGLQYNRPVRIGENVWIGACVTILPGVTIGDGSVIGAGSLVLRDVPPGVVAVGSPARVIRSVEGRAHDEPEYEAPTPASSQVERRTER